MGKIKVLFLVATFAVAMLTCASAQDLASVKKAFDQKYAYTTTTADKTDIVKAGDVLVLKKSNLITVDVSKRMLMAPNTYKNGRITYPIILKAQKDGTRTFVSGEKVWVTDIEVKPKGIVFSLYTDAFNDVRYRASLTFPIEKDTTPTVAEAMAMAAEVFEVQPSGNGTDQAQSQPAAPPSGGAAPAPAAPAQQAALAPLPPPPPPPADPKTIALGQTIDQVTANFGAPQLIKKPSATKQIYVYKDMTVTFVGGKVTDIQ